MRSKSYRETCSSTTSRGCTLLLCTCLECPPPPSPPPPLVAIDRPPPSQLHPPLFFFEVRPTTYESELDVKIDSVEALFADCDGLPSRADWQIVRSARGFFRMRAEFRIWHDYGRKG